MSYPKPSFTVDVDVTNPGQFFACCGILELAHRLWDNVEGWFDTANSAFAMSAGGDHETQVERFLSIMRECDICGLPDEERRERELETEQSKSPKRGEKLAPDNDTRRKELGTHARGDVLGIGAPLDLTLDWWQTKASPKTWAGRQELHKITRASQEALSGLTELKRMFDYSCVLRPPKEYRKGKSDRAKVEPFYFDARRFAHSLDAGFSLDVQNAETIAHPAVELLALIGLQRFRPTAAPVKWRFDYWVWSQPLGAPVAGAVAGGTVPTHGGHGYRFPLRFRDDQKRYKAFGFAVPMGDHA